MAVPIFIVHWGNSDYLKYCLSQARYYNPKSQIVLIGDKSNNKYPFVKHYHSSGYSFNANLFSKSYVHLNTTIPAWYVKMWFKRWFVLKDFMKVQQFGEQFVYIDSDVMLYCDVTKEFEKFKNYDMTICGERAPHITFFNGVRPLEELCELITDMYMEPDMKKLLTNTYEEHKTRRKTGGIDDMTLISEYKERHHGQVGDNSQIIDGSTYDGNLTEPQDYEYNRRKGLKKIYWKDGYPYGRHLPDGNLVRFNSLHFIGSAKSVMHRYYSGPDLRMQRLMSEMRNSFYMPIKRKMS